MIVFDLICSGNHVFEAWFGSSAAYETQRAGGLLSCPICGDGEIAKAVMAPNVAAKGNRLASPSPPPDAAGASPVKADPPPELVKAVIARLAEAQSKMLEGSQWVGGSFAERARAMHHGEEDAAPIHGQASHAEAEALIDEGVAVAPLPFPVVPPEARN